MHFRQDAPASQGRADLIALGFGTTAAMWAVAYFWQLPEPRGLGPGGLVVMLLLLFGGGVLAGAWTTRGLLGGLQVGLINGLLNLLIIGSTLAEHHDRSILIWLPGTLLLTAAVGTIGAALGSLVRWRFKLGFSWTGLFALVTACLTLLLVIAGGAVTSKEAGLAVPDWPNSFRYNMFLLPLSKMTGGIYYEHAHRLLGSLVGITTLTLAIHLQRARLAAWIKRLGWTAFGLVVIQGILGGLRVTGVLTLATEGLSPSTTLAVVHGTLGQIIFALLCVIAAALGTGWAKAEGMRHAQVLADRRVHWWLCGLLTVQLVLGAIYRHFNFTGALHMHIAVAVAVAIVAGAAGGRAWGAYRDFPPLKQSGLVLSSILGVQILLGLLALIAVGMYAGVRPEPTLVVVIATIHQTGGALLLAAAAAQLAWLHRVQPLAPAA